MAMKVLVVDDEPHITELVTTTFRYEGFDTGEAHTGHAALTQIAADPPDLVVLDIMLPDIDGLEVTRRMRAAGVQVPVLFLTARDATEDKVAGLTVGGDDYVAKPFSLEELVARSRAILRRTQPELKRDDHRVTFSDLTLDEDTFEVWRNGTAIHLSQTEFRLLRYFMQNPRRVLSKGQILDRIWQYDFGGDSNVVETYVSYLRKKIDTLGPPLLHTVRGVGYSLRLPSS